MRFGWQLCSIFASKINQNLVLEASWGVLWASCGRLGGVLGRLGASRGVLDAFLGGSWAVLGRLGAVLGWSWAVLGILGAVLGPQGGHGHLWQLHKGCSLVGTPQGLLVN